MITVQVVAQITLLGDESAEPRELYWGFYDFEIMPRIGELIHVWRDNDLEELRVVRVEHVAVHERPVEVSESDLIVSDRTSVTRIVAKWPLE